VDADDATDSVSLRVERIEVVRVRAFPLPPSGSLRVSREPVTERESPFASLPLRFEPTEAERRSTRSRPAVARS